MNEKIREQIERAKTQTIGVEVEMNNITRNKAAKIAAEFFGTGRYENTADRNGYCTWSAWDTEGREWKFQKDVSIAGPDDKKCELVTPILHYSDIETLQELIRKLRHAGAVSNAQVGAGVHIHIGANGHTPQTLRNLANIMASHEELIAEALKLDRTRISRYCRTVDPNFLEQLNNKKPKTMSALADIWYRSQGESYGRNAHYNGSRYRMLTTIQYSQRERSSSDFSNSTTPQPNAEADFMPDSLKATYSFRFYSAKWQRNSNQQAQSHSKRKTKSTQ